MPRAVAVNVAANTNEPGFRGPVYPDGSFAYVPIPESEPTCSRPRFPVDEPVPTYGDLTAALGFSLPTSLHDTPMHADPEFPATHGRAHATYGDPYAVKAGRIGDLRPGDWLLFYATLTLRPHDWVGPGDVRVGDAGADTRSGEWLREHGVEVAADIAPDWGAYLFAGIHIDRVLAPADGVVDRETAAAVAPTNAHLKRDPFDARIIVTGDSKSGCFHRVVPLSASSAGVDANQIVTDLSSDSGRGPWWRRPLAFSEDATATILDRVEQDARLDS